jgi:hypothetical protein
MTLILFTVATFESGYMNELKQSCNNNNISMHVVGDGVKWDGWQTKLKLIHEFVEKIPKEQFVLYTDAYDSFIVANEEEIIKAYYEATNGDDSKILFTATKSDFWYKSIFGDICGNKNDVYNSLNAGGFMGKAKYITNLFKNYCDKEKNKNKCYEKNIDDQKIFNDICLKKDSNIILDSNCHVFYIFDWTNTLISYLNLLQKKQRETLPIENEFYFFDNKTNRLIVRETGSKPCVLHANGNANCDIIINKIGISNNTNNINYKNRNFFNYSTILYMNSLLKKLLFYTLVFIHYGIIGFIFLYGFFTSNIQLLYIFIILNILLIISWKVCNGKCILSIWENELIDKEIHNFSVVNLFLSKKLNLSSKTISNFFTILPYFSIFAYLIRIFILSKKSKKFKNK